MSDTTATQIDTKVQTLAAQAASTTEENAGLIAKIVAVVTVALWGFYMQYQLNEKTEELAKLQAEVDNAKLAAAQRAIAAKSSVYNDTENQVLQAALSGLKAVQAQQADLDKAKQEHVDRVNRVKALQNWTDLNKLAGVTP